MLTHTPRNARQVIEQFKRADAPCILVSPSVVEGFDFPMDECRWQIIAKVPFPDGRDLVFKARKKSDSDYGNYLASLAITQMVGRSTRSAEDASECVAPDTLVLTDDLRWVPAGDVKRGSRLLGIDEECDRLAEWPNNAINRRRWKLAIVEKSIIRKMPRMRVITDDREVVCTPNHPWLIFGRGAKQARMLLWKRTDELTADDHLIVSLDVWKTDHSWEAGWASGFIDGEGCLVTDAGRKHPCVAGLLVTQNAGPTMDRARRILAGLGYEFSVNEKKTKLKETHGRLQILRLKGGLPELYRFLGSVRPQRLLDKFTGLEDHHPQFIRHRLTQVVRVEKLRDGDISSLQTSARTYMAAGLVAHNTFIIDDHWGWMRKRIAWPRWFKESWRQSDSIPPPLAL